ncbi:MAG: iron ABC transporter permease [Rhodospirillaceae bacterium]|nr:iron ABC transporter permease [Rhodospirillaceae bacterium]
MSVADYVPAVAETRRQAAGLDLSGPVLAATGLFLVALICLPIGWLVAFAFASREGAPTLANFEALLLDPTLSEPLFTTMSLSLMVAVSAVIAATPLAWLVAATDLPGRRLVRMLMTASFVTPPFLGAIAWEILAAPNSGIINKLWRDLTGAQDALIDIYTFAGLVFVITTYTAPYVFIVVTNAIDRIPADLEDAAGILGASRTRIVLGITLPLVLPALLAGALIAFLQAMTLFGSPAILAIPAGFHTVTTKIYSLFQFPPKPQLAAAAALPLLVVTVMLLWLQARILGRRGYAVLGGKNSEPRLTPLGVWRWPALLFVLCVLALPLFLPYLALLKAAFSRIASGPLSPGNLTLENFTFVFLEFSQTQRAFTNTFVLALATACVGALLALILPGLGWRPPGSSWV